MYDNVTSGAVVRAMEKDRGGGGEREGRRGRKGGGEGIGREGKNQREREGGRE